MNIRYLVELSEAERCELTALVGSGKHYARKIKRAQDSCSRPTAGSATKKLPLLWLSAARPFTGPSAASLKIILEVTTALNEEPRAQG